MTDGVNNAGFIEPETASQIAKEYGSVPAIYNKLYSIFERMDTSSTSLRNDVVPSF